MHHRTFQCKCGADDDDKDFCFGLSSIFFPIILADVRKNKQTSRQLLNAFANI